MSCGAARALGPRATSQDKATGLLSGPTHPPAPSPPARLELSVPRTNGGLPKAHRLPRALLGVQVLLTELRVPSLLSAGRVGGGSHRGAGQSLRVLLNSEKTRGGSTQTCLGRSTPHSVPPAAPPQAS